MNFVQFNSHEVFSDIFFVWLFSYDTSFSKLSFFTYILMIFKADNLQLKFM